jgi:hypothetical protein
LNSKQRDFGNTEIKYPKGVLKMPENRISANLSPADKEAVMQAIASGS